MWDYAIGYKYETRYFDNEKEAKEYFNSLLGRKNKPLAFKLVDGVYEPINFNNAKA